MPNPVFIALAVAMVLVALAALLLPLMRRGEPAPLAAGALIALVPLSVSLMYFSYSNWQWDLPAAASGAAQTDQAAQAAQAASVDQMVSRLEQRLENEPTDVEGWSMLGRSYVVLGRYAEAVNAYGQARELTADEDVNAVTGYAEALAMVRGGAIDAEIAGLFDRALEMDPADRKALWYGGVAALEGGRPALARSRWQRLLDAGPPEEMARVLREQIAAAESMLGDSAPVGAVAAAPAPTASAGVVLSVSLADDLADRAGANAPVFIFARQVGAAGPPLAVVRRTVADLPLRITLSDDDAMVPGRVLSAFDSVEIVARVALGGTPTAQPGDLAGTRIVPSTGEAAILIDEIVTR